MTTSRAVHGSLSQRQQMEVVRVGVLFDDGKTMDLCLQPGETASDFIRHLVAEHGEYIVVPDGVTRL